jgi:erythrin-vacuolar iron transport family protein
MATIISAARRQRDQRSFLLQRAQPAMVGLIDGSLSTLAPIFAVALATHQPRYAFLAGLATPIGAGVSMAFSEGLSDTGDLTGAITGAGTFLGGILHTLPFLIPDHRSAVLLALAVIAFELLALAWIRRRFFGTGFLSSLLSVTLGGATSPRSAPRWAQSDDRRRRFGPNPQEGPRPHRPHKDPI